MAIAADGRQLAVDGGGSSTVSGRLAEYRTLLRMDRRRRYLGLSAVGIGLLWLTLVALYYLNAGFPFALPLGIGISVLMPALALVYEALRQPTSIDTARTLDALLDNRERVLTSVELLDAGGTKDEGRGTKVGSGQQSEMERAQLASTARLLSAVEPRALYPARMPVAQLAIAGGLLVLAIGLWLLKAANDDLALAQGGLPAGIDTTGVIATPTADPGLPGTNEAPQADPGAQDPSQQESNSSTLPGAPSAEGGNSGSSGTTSQMSQDEAQQRADASREAEKSLQRLSRAMDEQGVTQDVADSLRKGDYSAAGDALSQLGENNDQLSQEAKDALSESLDAAADDSSGTPDLQDAERKAAEALKNGTYGEIRKAMEDLSQAVENTGDQVVPQQDLAKDFPTDPSTSATPASGQDGSSSANNNGQDQPQGQPSASDEPGQPGQGTEQVPGNSGQQAQPGNGDNGAAAEASGGQAGTPSNQGQGSGAGDPGLPGEGSRVDGPKGEGLDVAGDPFALQGNDMPNPDNLRPGDGSEPPAMTLEGDPGGSGAATSPAQGGPVDATGETSAPPMDRWGIVQKYFSRGER